MVKSNTLSAVAKELNISDHVLQYTNLYPGKTVTGDPEQDVQLLNILRTLGKDSPLPVSLVDYMIDHDLIEVVSVRQAVRQQERQVLTDLKSQVEALNLIIRKGGH